MEKPHKNKNKKPRASPAKHSDDDDNKERLRLFDPDGTVDVARGVQQHQPQPSTQNEILAQLSSEQRVLVERHLSRDEWAHERRRLLQHDDAHSTHTRLTERQQYHLKQRQKSNKKVTVQLQRLESKRVRAAVASVQAAAILQDSSQAGCLEAENDMERTLAVTQTQLKRWQPAIAHHCYDLQLTAKAPYRTQYDRTGRYALLAGTQGHVAILDAHNRTLLTEFHLPGERIRDATFLHNQTLVAVAQRNHVYIYDPSGAEVHWLEHHTDPQHLQFLPYHWLLASTGRAGYLKYQDTSTGQLVSQHRMKLSATALKQNPANAVLFTGHTNGVVSLWSPAQSTYLAQLHCHKGSAVTDVAIDLEGRTLVTAGMDRQINIWDLRMYRQRHQYYCAAAPATSLDLSQRNLLAVGHGSHVTIWGAEALQHKVSSPYMHHQLGVAGDNRASGPVETVRFRPFEDACGIGHAAGVSSIAVPGSGEPALDTTELNPLQDTRQRQETEVRQLLDKLSPDMIVLDADMVGGMEASDPATRLERLQHLQEEANAKPNRPTKTKTKKRGRSKIQTQLRRKHKNIIDQSTLRLKEAREQERAASTNATSTTETDKPKDLAPAALKRFFS